MSDLSKSPKDVSLLAVADLHLTLKPPLARSCEKDWMQVQKGYLQQLWRMKEKYKVPIVVCGDIFDTWRVNPELINFVIKHLPRCYAIPGNHDLPYHSYGNIYKSAYWTLVEAGIVTNMNPNGITDLEHFVISPFPFGFEISPLDSPTHDLCTDIAVVHDYIWTKQTGFHGAPEDHRLKSYMKKCKGYKTVIFGDNHKGFIINKPNQTVINCGSFMRRHYDEMDYKPYVSLIHYDGKASKEYLDVSADKFIDKREAAKLAEKAFGLTDFIEELQEGANSLFNFVDAVNLWLKKNKVDPSLKKAILETMEE